MLKKMAITAACSVGCCLLVTLWIVPSIYQARVAAAPVPSSNTSVSAVSSAYRVAAYNGFVAAFDGDSEQPFLILDTPIRALRPKWHSAERHRARFPPFGRECRA